MRYSEQRLTEDFTAYVLFSERFQGSVGGVLAAAAASFPGLDWSTCQMGGDAIDTRSVTLSTDLGLVDRGQPSPTRGATSFFGSPGRCQIDWEDVIAKSRLIFPEGRRAVQRHTDYLGLRVGSAADDTSVAARFDAARRLTCLAAVCARLPSCVGVYFPNGDTLVTPENWVRAADIAMRGEVPVTEWMTLFITLFDRPTEPRPVTVSTVGLAAFNGHEIVLPKARLAAADAAQWVFNAVRMLLEAGHTLTDGDTLGVEGQTDTPIRIRHAQEGQHDAQTDQWVLIHETSGLDDERLFGPSTRRPAKPAAQSRVTQSYDTLKNQLYGFVTASP